MTTLNPNSLLPALRLQILPLSRLPGSKLLSPILLIRIFSFFKEDLNKIGKREKVKKSGRARIAKDKDRGGKLLERWWGNGGLLMGKGWLEWGTCWKWSGGWRIYQLHINSIFRLINIIKLSLLFSRPKGVTHSTTFLCTPIDLPATLNFSHFCSDFNNISKLPMEEEEHVCGCWKR